VLENDATKIEISEYTFDREELTPHQGATKATREVFYGAKM
jgi:hypothetical protein